ncbi:MAG TPA: uroporphyrinogen decarboxylase family protein [Clostridia bacterium]|nr:uroporphyrinogen decarboxylase family protein [Clostridia bacterium]
MLRGEPLTKRPSKETLNHPGILRMASGRDPYLDTQRAFVESYAALGIDIVNRVPDSNAPTPTPPGEKRRHNERYDKTHLGVYDTYFRHTYPFADSEEFFRTGMFQPDYFRLITPVPHRLDADTIRSKDCILGDVGIYYYQLYTTLFMWAVEELGWEVFLTAAAEDPDRFDALFWQPAQRESERLLRILAEVDTPFVFVHDDLADARGPVFRPTFYERYIFPRYLTLWEPLHRAGKIVIFVADGNMSVLLGDIAATGVDGVMIETPATPLETLLDVFSGRIVIGGIDTKELTFGTEQSIRAHVARVCETAAGCPGFALCASGGLHGNIPIENLAAYFDARVPFGYTRPDWRAADRDVHGKAGD